MSPPSHAQLGAVVRERRELAGLSMARLAEAARVSRSSIHRLEHGSEIRLMPSKLARVLATLGVDEDTVRDTMADDEYRSDLLHWMAAREGAESLLELPTASVPVDPDLVILHRDGTIAQVMGGGDHLDELADALKRAGWLVTRPA